MPPPSSIPSATRVGQGVSLAAIDPRLLETPPPLPTTQEEPNEEKDKVQWADTPCVANQTAKHPDTVRLGESVTEIFDLSDPERLKAYNALRSKQRPIDPSIAEVHLDRRFIKATNTWIVLFEYRKIEYKQLVPIGKPTPKPAAKPVTTPAATS